jgi:hypothetical protein
LSAKRQKFPAHNIGLALEALDLAFAGAALQGGIRCVGREIIGGGATAKLWESTTLNSHVFR